MLSSIPLQQSHLDADQLSTRLAIAWRQLASRSATAAARIDAQQAEVEEARAVLDLKQRQVADLTVRAGVPGVLQVVPIDVGQQVAAGINLARVSNPARLKAELRIGETQAKGVVLGQPASIDTHNGIVAGVVSRIDPSVQNGAVTVDVALSGELPPGARPDLTIDGIIELERLQDVLFVGPPAFGQEKGSVGIYRVRADGEAERVAVTLRRTSVDTAEIVAGEPALLPADEPTGNLDSKSGDSVMALIRELREQGATICVVTHDRRYARQATRRTHLFDGRLASEPALNMDYALRVESSFA